MKGSVKRSISVPVALDRSICRLAEKRGLTYSAAISELASYSIERDLDEPIAPRVHAIVRHEGDSLAWRIDDSMREVADLIMDHFDSVAMSFPHDGEGDDADAEDSEGSYL